MDQVAQRRLLAAQAEDELAPDELPRPARPAPGKVTRTARASQVQFAAGPARAPRGLAPGKVSLTSRVDAVQLHPGPPRAAGLSGQRPAGGITHEVTVDVVELRPREPGPRMGQPARDTSSPNVDAQVAQANRIYNPHGLRVVVGRRHTVDGRPAQTLLARDERDAVAQAHRTPTPPRQVRALEQRAHDLEPGFDATPRYGSQDDARDVSAEAHDILRQYGRNGAVTAVWVPRHVSAHPRDGIAFDPTFQRGMAGLGVGVVLSNDARPDTLAHELGHVLLHTGHVDLDGSDENGNGRPDEELADGRETDDRNLMESGSFRTGDDLSPAQVRRLLAARPYVRRIAADPPAAGEPQRLQRATTAHAHADRSPADLAAAAAQGVVDARGPLPFGDVIGAAFGRHDVTAVRVAVGGVAAQAAEHLGAHAYATGDTIAFADPPDLRLAAHEAAHVVQQRAGVQLADGLGRAGDDYERHADAVADAVVRGASVESLLDAMPGGTAPAAAPAEAGPGQALSAAVRSRMEDAFDFRFDAVRIHEDGAAAAAGAIALAHGTDLHFAPGHYDPGNERGLALLGHELAHVVQQAEGRVTATAQYAGLAIDDRADLEREADVWGVRAARGQPVGRARGGDARAAAVSQRAVAQRAPQTSHWGRFVDTTYRLGVEGAEATITFEPGPNTDATKIGFSQSVRNVAEGQPQTIDPSQEQRMVPAGPGAGGRIDTFTGPRGDVQDNPVYGALPDGPGGTLAETPERNARPGLAPPFQPGNGISYELGHHFTDVAGPHTRNAWMYDAPSRGAHPSTSMRFESTALALEGTQAGTYYGSVRWGWERNANGQLRLLDFELASHGAPTQDFLAPAAQWNSTTGRGTIVTRAAATQVFGQVGDAAPRFTLPAGVTVTVRDHSVDNHGAVQFQEVDIVSGDHQGDHGFVRVRDLRDVGDGPATIDLPVPDVHTLTEAQELRLEPPGELAELHLGGPPRRRPLVLPAGTRVVPDPRRLGEPGPPPGWRHVRVVDGPFTGRDGYLQEAALADERR